MSYPLINGAAINADSAAENTIPGLSLCAAGEPLAVFEFDVAGSMVWGFGALAAKIGEDVELYLPGISLVQSPWHSAEASQPPANTAFSVSGSRVLGIGAMRAVAGSLEGQAQGAVVLGFGALAAEPVGFASGAKVLGLGEVSASRIGWVPSARVLGMGSLTVVSSVAIPGVSLCRSGSVAVTIAGMDGQVEGSQVLGFGALTVSYAVRAGQSLALGIGAVRVERGSEC
ncbi:hypothetical protein M2375_000947 [Comamonas sp. BIGb0152]|uniref:hypothetical protein n=1 Tax=Comamonas sp. BIGb0152 TaxID=2940601 RepID=UPI0021670C20|nr:hypothetical protein [Comamonas sp. BIGb0152]MCS4292741.1 hypothetical protein [Comamonas sp. BIGb0152]